MVTVIAAVLFSMLIVLTSGSVSWAGSIDPGRSETPRGGSTPGSDWRNPGSDDGRGSGGGSGGGTAGCGGANCRYTSFTQTYSGAGGGCAARQGPGSQGGQQIGYTTRTTTVTYDVWRPGRGPGGNLFDGLQKFAQNSGLGDQLLAGTWSPINDNIIDGELNPPEAELGHWVLG